MRLLLSLTRIGLLLGFCFLASGCSSLSNIYNSTLSLVGLGSENNLSQVTVEGRGDINLGNPVAFDFVYIFDQSLGSTLSDLSAPQWFSQKNQLQLKYGQKLLVKSLDIVPFTSTKVIEMPDNANDANMILLYANYIADAGKVAASLTTYKNVHIVFANDHYQLSGSDD